MRFPFRRAPLSVLIFTLIVLAVYLLNLLNFKDNNGKIAYVDISGINPEELQSMSQDDPNLWKYIRTFHITPPSTKQYRLDHPDKVGDPSDVNAFGALKLVLKILKNMRNGLFVEVGAYDGEKYSNTLALERDFGWTGILIEGDPMTYPLLKKKHRKSWISDVCLSPSTHPQIVEFMHADNYDIASRIDEPTDVVKEWTPFDVQCFPLFSILCAVNITTIDYFSLDVEGIEMKVLYSLPFDRVFAKIFLIEWQLIPEGPEVLKKFMKHRGYKLVLATQINFMFVHETAIDESFIIDSNLQ